MKVCLGLDDFSVVNNRLLWLYTLKEHFPKFKVSLFTVPIDKKEDWGPYTIREDFLSEIKKNLDWMQLIPHGLNHNGPEAVKWDYDYMKDFVIPSIEESFLDDLPIVKGFKAPHWAWNENVVKALDDLGWWGAVDRDKDMPCTKRFYKYNYALDEPFWEKDEDLKLHGHIYGTKTDLGKCFDNLLKLPISTEFVFATDFLETK